MSSSVNNHPDHATLQAFRSGRLAADKHAEVQKHLGECSKCFEQLAVSRLHPPENAPSTISPPISPEIPIPLVDHPRYKILGQLGEGGMGVVYKAEHRVMGRMVALKVLNPESLSAHPTVIDRFRREVRLASRLSHPNIVTAYDADEAGGLHFLVMEYVDGLSLERVVNTRGPLPVSMACEIIHEAAMGLQHAHEKGMVHRDIKPHNLMLTRTGEIKILDFGLARVAVAAGNDPASMTAMALTTPQTLVGTPDFLSPEQARCATDLDIRSDIYSLGCTLYYLLTGKPPFEGAGAYAKMIAHFKDPPPELSVACPDAPPELGEILQTLMAKSPDDRYQTPAEVAEALKPFMGVGLEAADSEADGSLESRDSWFLEERGATCEETQPSYVSDQTSSSLPMVSEMESGIVDLQTLYKPQEAATEQPKPVRKRRGRLFLFALLALFGVTVGCFANWMTHTSEQDPTLEARVAQKGPEPLTDARSFTQSSDSGIAQSLPTETVPEPPPPQTPPEKSTPQTPAPTPVTTPVTQPSHANRRKQVLLLIPPEYAHNELGTVSDSLKSKNATVLTASAERKLLEGYRYAKENRTLVAHITPEYTLKEITSTLLDTVDGIILMPGETKTFTQRLLAGSDVKRIVEKALQKKKVIGAIGSGVIVLGSHGFLEHFEASTVQNRALSASQLKVRAWKDEPKVVVDLPFITVGEFSHTKGLVDEMIRTIVENARRQDGG
jgi:serine/threonine protein kinase